MPALEVSTTDPPVQNDVAGDMIVDVGNVFTVITIGAEVDID